MSKLGKRTLKKIKKSIKNLIKKEKKLGGEIIKMINVENVSDWHPSNFKNLIKLIEDKSDKIKTDNILIASNLKSLLNEQ